MARIAEEQISRSLFPDINASENTLAPRKGFPVFMESEPNYFAQSCLHITRFLPQVLWLQPPSQQ